MLVTKGGGAAVEVRAGPAREGQPGGRVGRGADGGGQPPGSVQLRLHGWGPGKKALSAFPHVYTHF